MKRILLIVSLLLANYISSASTDKCSENDKVAKSSRLHHIIEFGKRSKVEGKGCKNSSSSKSSEHILGLHGLLHARSKKNNTKNIFGGTKKVSSNKTITLQKPKNEAGSKRTNAELHKLQLRKETISMLHKIVEKYFPGGHLTVEQKIKALKILGKLIKLKKEGKNSDIKKLLGVLSTHKPSDESSDYSNVSKVKKKTKNGESGKKDDTGQSGGDIYANIASGPDVPKLPPSVSGKDPDHAHSNIMPVGLQPLGRGGGAGEMMSTLTQPNDISDNLNDRISSYQAPIPNSQGAMGLGQIYQNRNNLLRNGMGLSGIPNMMDGQGYARSRMPYPRRYWLNARHRYYSDEYDDDDDDDEEDDNEDDSDLDEDEGRARSYVNRHHFYDDIDNDDDDGGGENGDGEEIEYSRRFDRKNKIAKIPKKLKKKSLK